ncbi:MAG: hypothetical protein ACLFTI_00230 [Anaerolineales bacterium]
METKKWSRAWADILTEELDRPVRLRVRGASMAPTLRPGDVVMVEPITDAALRLGDWVLVRGERENYLHRYVGRRADRVLTKGDAHRRLDPPWSPAAIRGRVTAAYRDDACYYRRTPRRQRRERVRAVGHRVGGEVWSALARLKSWLLLLLLLAVTITGVYAAVTVTEFTAQWDGDQVHLHWETASETGNLGFMLWRREEGEGDFETIFVEIPSEEGLTDFVPGIGDIVGASYDAYDVNVTPGIAYEYQLQDAPDDGSEGEMFGPVTPMANDTPTPTSTPTPQPAATATPTIRPTRTPTANPSPSPTPTPRVQFWADQENLAAGTCTTLHWTTENIQAAHLNGEGVDGSSSKTVCPCEDVTYTLRVIYKDDTEEDFDIALSVTGTCDDASDATATATPFRVTTATPGATPTASPTPTTSAADAPTATPTSSPTAASASGAETDSPLPTPAALTPTLAAPDPADSTVTPSTTASPTRPAVAGEQPAFASQERPSNLLLLGGGIGFGLLLIGVGVWLWGRHR